jgi:hypothetical protein
MKRRTNVWLDDGDRANAQIVAAHYGLDSISAALRFAANELARRIQVAPNDSQKDSHSKSKPKNER